MGGTGVLHPTYGWPWIRIETTMVTTGIPRAMVEPPDVYHPINSPGAHPAPWWGIRPSADWAASTHCPHCPWRIPVSMEMAYVVGLWWDHEDKKRDAGQSILSIPVSLRYSLSHPVIHLMCDHWVPITQVSIFLLIIESLRMCVCLSPKKYDGT